MAENKNVFSKSKKQLLSEKIHDEILEMIIKNATDEDMVLNEGRLMEVFQVSKAPVREALIKLCAEGVLQSVPRYGYLVIRQQEKDKREVSRMRILLELEALKEGYEEIIQYHLPELLQQIEGINGAKQIDDVWAIWEDNCEFHLRLASYSKNRLLLRYLQETMDRQKRIYAQQAWESQKTLKATFNDNSHKRIWKELSNHNLEQALQCLEKDISQQSDEGIMQM